MIYDATVVGAGPAGSTVAYLLARRGFQVLLLDKSIFPRKKPCGGALSPKAYRQLDFNPSGLVRSRIGRTLMKGPWGNAFLISLSDADVWMVCREEFDLALLERAGRAGAQIHQGEALESIRLGGEVVITGQAEYRTRVLVGADGCHSLVAKAAGLTRRPLLWFRALHVEAPAQGESGDRAILDFRYPEGYAWLFPKGEVVNAGICSRKPGWDLRPALEAFLRREGLNPGEIPPFHGWPIPLGSSARKLDSGSTLVVGDAAGLADPLLGEGIAYAMMSGRLAADAVASYLSGTSESLSSYSEAMRKTVFRDLAGLAAGSVLLYKFPLVILYLFRSMPPLRHLASNILSGNRSLSHVWRRGASSL